MGIRISMRLVVGVDNYEGEDDKRFSVPLDWTYKQEDKIPLVGGSIHDIEFSQAVQLSVNLIGSERDTSNVDAYQVFHVPTEDYGVPNLFGVTVSELPYAHDVLWALVTIDPRFEEDGYIEVGKYTPDGVYARMRTPEFVNLNRLYKFGLDNDCHWWVDAAMYFFKWIGFDVSRDDLRLFLEWHWS